MTKENVDNIPDILRDSPLLVSLDEGELKELANLSTIRRFEKSDLIFMEGDPVDFLFFLAEGRVKIFKTSPSGRVITLMVAKRGDPIISNVSHSISTKTTREFSSKALDNVIAVSIKKDQFVEFQIKYPKLGVAISGMFGQLLSSAYERIIDLLDEEVEQRLINILYILYSKFGSLLSFTSEEFSDLVGSTPSTTIKMFSKLRKTGLIRTGRGKIFILDGERLEKLSRTTFKL